MTGDQIETTLASLGGFIAYIIQNPICNSIQYGERIDDIKWLLFVGSYVNSNLAPWALSVDLYQILKPNVENRVDNSNIFIDDKYKLFCRLIE